MDFIEKLPPSSGYTSILVIVDRLSKQSLFIPTHDTLHHLNLPQLFVLHIFSKHGVPSHVTSDRVMEFVSHFFLVPWNCAGHEASLHFRYHPQGDGQTERTNQTLETVPPSLLQLPTRQLVRTPSISLSSLITIL